MIIDWTPFYWQDNYAFATPWGQLWPVYGQATPLTLIGHSDKKWVGETQEIGFSYAIDTSVGLS